MSEAPAPRQDVHPMFQLASARPNRLVHLMPDELADAVPDHPLFSYARGAKPQDGFVEVSCKSFADAVNKASWYLRNLLGPPENFEAVGYMGPSDIRYFLFMFGAIKVGYKMLFLSPRNNLEGHLNVLQGVNCRVFLRAKETSIEPILNERPMDSWVVPELEMFLNDPVETYPYTKTFEEACMDPCLVLHTTGSTGLPKPVTWKVGILSTYEAWRTIPPVDGYVPTTVIYQQSRRAYTSMPLFHTSGLNAGITWAMSLGVTLVYGAPQVVPNAAYTDEMHKYAGVDASMGAPSIYEELSRHEDALDRMKRLHYVVASGAPLSHRAGTLISKYTRVICNLGATETACLQRLAPSVDDWAYFYWHPTCSGIEMRETTDALYELFIVRDEKLKLHQGVFNTFPDIQEWSMKDLYSKHPDPAKSFLYRYQCRKDDVIVLSNGEKIAPALIEATLMSHPLVKGAMVVGRGKFQPAVLIDLFARAPMETSEKHQLIERLAPVIAEANLHAPAHGKLDQYHILFADPKKPIKYLGQGKIQRHSTYKLYEHDIEALYRAMENGREQFGLLDLPNLDLTHRQSIALWLERLIAEIAGITIAERNCNLFVSGVDSLHVMRMARELRLHGRRSFGERSSDVFSPAAIYSRPTIDLLTDYIFDKASSISHGSSKMNGNHTAPHPETQSMQQLLVSYTDSLPRSSGPSPLPSTQNMTVILTGSTGSLGSYLLDTLCQSADAAHIICLNRSPDAAKKHAILAVQRGFKPIDESRVEFLQADLSMPRFGLKAPVYTRLLRSVTHIIHNQWPVNFNWSFSTFEPFIRGVRNLVDFANVSNHHAFIMFISSVSAIGSWKGPSPAPERPIHDLAVASDIGYGQSKLVSECLLDKAAEISGVRSACCRVGIVAGPAEEELGMWNQHEYIPALILAILIIISSAYLNAFPVDFPSRESVDWIPVDKLANILLEVLMSSCARFHVDTGAETQLYHIINPSSIFWSNLSIDILACYPGDIAIEPVSFKDWVRILERTASETMDTERIPAIKLVEFYRRVEAEPPGSRELSSTRAEKASKLLRSVGPVNQGWMRSWMQQWGIRGSGDVSSGRSTRTSSSEFLRLN